LGDAQNGGNAMKRIITATCMIMMASAVNAKEPLVVTMSATVSGGVHPIVTGRTNLPDGMKLVVELAHPCDEDQERRFMELDRGRYFPACINQLDLIEADVVVAKGQFKTGPWWHAHWDRPASGIGLGLPVTPGQYVMYVFTRALDFEPSEVRAVIGDAGQNLAGPLISRNLGVGVSWVTRVTIQ
jgi:hypothetical protein